MRRNRRTACVEIKPAASADAAKLTEVQARAFADDNKRKPPGCSMEGPPGFDSLAWNLESIERTPYYKVLLDGRIVGGIIVFAVGEGQYELGRIYVDPDVQDRGVGQEAMRLMFEAFPEARKWTVGTPSWAIRNQHVYEKVGFVRVRETAVDPQLGWSGVEYERHCPGDREGADE